MDSGLTLALERRLKLLPNRATIGIQAQIQDALFQLPKFSRKLKKTPNSVIDSRSGESHFKDAKIGTDPILTETQSKINRKILPLANFRLKGVMTEEHNDLQLIDKTNEVLKFEINKVKKYLLRRM